MSEVHRTIDAIWRIESPRLIAGLVRMVGDVGLRAVDDALVVVPMLARLYKGEVAAPPDHYSAIMRFLRQHHPRLHRLRKA